jgi:NAD(P)-dependent dehydrogenase (short-subunit alcohol dehydrogenase family)
MNTFLSHGELLQDKTAVITGGASGIGRATATLFASESARIAILDFDREKGIKSELEIRSAGGEATLLVTDVSNGTEVEQSMAQVVKHYDKIDILVNVVGVSGRRWGDGPVTECSEEAWNRLMDTNLKSVFLCCKFGIREMLESGGGTVINISSVLGLVGGDEDFATHAYAATKGGIISLTRSIATYYARQKIRANVICPGLIATPMSNRAQKSDKIRNKLSELQPLTGDFGSPSDVANAALYLASSYSEFVTGSILTVDGGWTAK